MLRVLSAPVELRAPFAPVKLRAHDASDVVVPFARADGEPPELVTEKPEANEMSQGEAREDAVISETIDQRHGRRGRVSHSEE